MTPMMLTRRASILTASALAMSLTFSGCRTASSAASSAMPSSAAPSSAIIEQWRQAYEVRSVDALAKLYDPSEKLVYVHQGKRYNGWLAAAAVITERLAGATELHMDLRDISVRSIAGATLIDCNMTREISVSSTTVKESGVVSMVIIDGKIAVEHFSFRGQ
jgi:SnoaL-like domain